MKALLTSLLALIEIISSLQSTLGQAVGPTSAEGSLIQQNSISGLRILKASTAPDKVIYISDIGREGLFSCDPKDKNTPDDSAMVIVTAGGQRFKRIVDRGELKVGWFGATGNGASDDWYSIQKGINYILNNDAVGRTLYFPMGTYKISKPLIIARLNGSNYRQTSINLTGPANTKDLAVGAAWIVPSFANTFAIGIQLGKGILIKDLGIKGRFTLPNTMTSIQVDTLSFDEWADGVCRNNTLSPYSGIVIDPFCDSSVYRKNEDMYPGLHNYYQPGISRGGSTAVQVVGCSIQNFIVGVMVSPSWQQNGELIDVLDCDISGNKVAYAMGQAQSKECHVQRLKCWAPTHTVFDNATYGIRRGDGAEIPMVDGVNIASSVKQLCRMYAVSFGGSFRNVYAEGLFRLGCIGGVAGIAFEDCQFNFSTLGEGTPYPDFLILGSGVSFYNCMLRHYTGSKGTRLILSGTNNHYEGGVMNEPPVSINLDNGSNYPNPVFRNVAMYYSGGILGNNNYGRVNVASSFKGSNGKGIDPVYFGNTYYFQDNANSVDLGYKFTYNDTYERTARLSGTPVIHINKKNWTGFFRLIRETDKSFLQAGDFILTSGLRYQDQFTDFYAPTYPVGRIIKIGHDTVYLTNLAYGIKEGMSLPLWMDYYVNSTPPFTGNISAESNIIDKVQGEFPAVGERPDAPMVPAGTYVTAINAAEKTVTLSNSNYTDKSFTDYTFINGYPVIEMFSGTDIAHLQKLNKTIFGGADFFYGNPAGKNSPRTEFIRTGAGTERYKIINTITKGDTSLHKLNYIPVSSPDLISTKSGETGNNPAIVNKSASVNIELTGNDQNMQVTITTKDVITGEIARIKFNKVWGTRPIAVLSCGNAFSAENSSRLFCNAASPAELVIGGNLSSKGVYIFNIHVGQ